MSEREVLMTIESGDERCGSGGDDCILSGENCPFEAQDEEGNCTAYRHKEWDQWSCGVRFPACLSAEAKARALREQITYLEDSNEHLEWTTENDMKENKRLYAEIASLNRRIDKQSGIPDSP